MLWSLSSATVCASDGTTSTVQRSKGQVALSSVEVARSGSCSFTHGKPLPSAHETERQRERQTERQRQTNRERNRDIQRHIGRQTDRQRGGGGGGEERQTDIHRDRERERETETGKVTPPKKTKNQETEREGRGCFGTFHYQQPAPSLGKVG